VIAVNDNVNAATEADRAAGDAFRQGDYDRAWLLIQQARELDADRAGLWDAHERRVLFAESQARPLDELMVARLTRAGFEPDDRALLNWATHNAALRDHELEA
jgi:hypothetical protein